MAESSIGLYGKLPAHGDFITRELPPGFVNIWDEWLQRGMLCSQEELGENWLDIYLTSPIWRFAFSSGVIDENSWAGVMIPSVDRVGRYFPFTLLAKLPVNANAFDVINSETSWFTHLENIALEGLEGHLDVDSMYSELQLVQALKKPGFKTNKQPTQALSANLSISMDFEEQVPASIFPGLLDYLLTKEGQSYSLWHTLGSELVSPCFLQSKGLPPARGLTALIDGNWQQHNWYQPVISLLPEQPEINQEVPEEIF